MQDIIINSFKSVFPNFGYITKKLALDNNGFIFWGLVGKDKTEWANGIVQNDPLNLNIIHHSSDDYIELECSFTIAPENVMFYASSVKLRKKKIKLEKINEKVLTDYFKSVHNMIMENKDKWHKSNVDMLSAKLILDTK